MSETRKRPQNWQPTPGTGHCGKCGKPARFVRMSYGMWWVHADTGNHLGFEPERHDVNTYIIRDGE